MFTCTDIYVINNEYKSVLHHNHISLRFNGPFRQLVYTSVSQNSRGELGISGFDPGRLGYPQNLPAHAHTHHPEKEPTHSHMGKLTTVINNSY